MIEVTDGFVRVKGVSHGLGEILNLGTDEEKRLVNLGVAKFVGDKKSTKSSKAADNEKKSDSNDTDGSGGPNTSIQLG